MNDARPTALQTLIRNFQEKTATVGVVGLGYAGLPLALRFSQAGYATIGFDIDESKIRMLQSGTSYIGHISSETIVSQGHLLRATTDFSLIREVDAVIICVPTPLGIHNEPDLSFVSNTIQAILPYVRPGQILALESTTYPGTTDEEVAAPLTEAGYVIGSDVFVVYSPEREDPGNANFHTAIIPKIVGGSTPRCLEAGTALYGGVVEKLVPVSSNRVAEMAKLLENIYRAVNIGLVNELKIVADKMNIDIWEVINAAATKPFGFTAFYPGPGLGGHCIPVDPFYLTWKAHEYGVHTRFIELAGEVNQGMPEWVVNKTIDALGLDKKSLNGAEILVLGVAYKKNVDDVRESPAIHLMELLKMRGAEISYSDPHIPVFPPMRRHKFELESVALTKEALAQFDCVILATDHDLFDYELIAQFAHRIVDTRGRFPQMPSVVKA